MKNKMTTIHGGMMKTKNGPEAWLSKCLHDEAEGLLAAILTLTVGSLDVPDEYKEVAA